MDMPVFCDSFDNSSAASIEFLMKPTKAPAPAVAPIVLNNLLAVEAAALKPASRRSTEANAVLVLSEADILMRNSSVIEDIS
jgi:hypothetical protein